MVGRNGHRRTQALTVGWDILRGVVLTHLPALHAGSEIDAAIDHGASGVGPSEAYLSASVAMPEGF